MNVTVATLILAPIEYSLIWNKVHDTHYSEVLLGKFNLTLKVQQDLYVYWLHVTVHDINDFKHT